MAINFLLNNLSANKHIHPSDIVPPTQVKSNCWFNSMFVTFFVSDKGRKFFHFLRQLMIEGKQQDGTLIPNNLKNAFSLLNFGIESCLTGNQYAYELDTNSIIHDIYKNIPENYKKINNIIVDVDYAGNPIYYYQSIINYLNNKNIILLLVEYKGSNWKTKITEFIKNENHLPHIIVLEIYDEDASKFNDKPTSFQENGAKYVLDSAVVRNINKHHFCATITCEGKEMGYDGMSFHRLVPLDWKNMLNTDFTWQFEGSLDSQNKNIEWNFTKCYQMLIYYRV